MRLKYEPCVSGLGIRVEVYIRFIIRFRLEAAGFSVQDLGVEVQGVREQGLVSGVEGERVYKLRGSKAPQLDGPAVEVRGYGLHTFHPQV